MERSYFRLVREALCTTFDASMGLLGITVLQGKTREWRQVKCPLCTDTNGSASISEQSGFLVCRQCARKQELFTWWGELNKLESSWASCQLLAQTLGVALDKEPKRAGGRYPKEMDHTVLEQSIQALWTDPAAEPLRRFLAARKIDDPQLLSALGVGAIGPSLSFAQWYPNGTLKHAYRIYSPSAAGSKWSWRGQKDTLGLWPYFPLEWVKRWDMDPANMSIAIFEGEWDCLTAWVRTQIWRQGVIPFTTTGGAGNTIPAAALPEDWRKKRVDVYFDNDVFQGPEWDKHRAPDERKKSEMERRRHNLIYRIGRLLQAHEVEAVYLHSIPLNPVDRWGGDYRDFVDAGGVSLEQIPGWHLDQVIEAATPPEVLAFEEVFQAAGKRAVFQAQVKNIELSSVVIPKTSEVDCPMGSFKFCDQCLAPSMFPARLIHWGDRPNDLAEALMAKEFEQSVFVLIAKPRVCQQCRIRHLDYDAGVRWTATAPDAEIEE